MVTGTRQAYLLYRKAHAINEGCFLLTCSENTWQSVFLSEGTPSNDISPRKKHNHSLNLKNIGKS